MVLLEAVHRLRPEFGLRLQAIHVHHGLSAHADSWVSHCENECAAREIPLIVRRVKVVRAGGESLEAKARALRYDAYAELDVDGILLAHHLDDQCETFFLRLLRGAGIEGLGGMQACRPLAPGVRVQVMRPFLEVTREQLMDYAQVRALRWINDDSNSDLRFARNYLRADVLPRMAQRFPGYRASVARAMVNLREAAAQRNAAIDTEGQGIARVLSLTALRALDMPNVLVRLRLFLRAHGVRPPSRSQLQEIWRQMRDAVDDAHVSIKVEGGTLRRYRDDMHWLADEPLSIAAEMDFSWSGQPSITLPGHKGELRFVEVMGEGIDQRLLAAPGWTIIHATPAMRLRLAPNRPTRTLKNLFQEAGIPPWQRRRTPVLCRQDVIAWVAGLGYDLSVRPAADSPGIRIEWISAHPDATPAPSPGP